MFDLLTSSGKKLGRNCEETDLMELTCQVRVPRTGPLFESLSLLRTWKPLLGKSKANKLITDLIC